MSARKNLSTTAQFEQSDLDNPFAQGAFRYVAIGKYTSGPRNNEKCVCKWFKTGVVYENHYYDTDIKVSHEAVKLIDEWNNAKLIDKTVQMNMPEVWVFVKESSRPGQKFMEEPFIDNYQKFNSNSGWNDSDLPWPKVMQALSHYSYHNSQGMFLLCDLQGGAYRDGIVLTDPVVMSRVEGDYGPTDLGQKGISTFFARHTCNEFCRKNWLKPPSPKAFHPEVQGTTMFSASGNRHAPTLFSRAKMTFKS